MSLLEEIAKLSGNAPETSRLAATKIAPNVGTLRYRVLREVVLSPRGCTDDELVSRVHKSPNSIRPRRVELVEGGFIVDSGTRRPSAYGNPAIVWVATDSGVEACQ